MKNQYFGDINDFKKYGLLRVLTDFGKISTAVCWMLTPDDNSSDGTLTEYLRHTEKWRQYDKKLYDNLSELLVVRQEKRDVKWVEKEGLLPSSRFYHRLLSDNIKERLNYFESFWEIATGCNLIFFDPGNGIEVKSIRCGSKNSSKYIYWEELRNAYSMGFSVLIYQHFPRAKRDAFISQLIEKIEIKINATKIYSFRTANVVFILMSFESMNEYFCRRMSCLSKIWHKEIEIQIH